eukprot:Em0257g1a
MLVATCCFGFVVGCWRRLLHRAKERTVQITHYMQYPITTKMNSFKQMKKAIFPVRVNARGCSLVHRDRGMAWAPGIEAANDP